MTVDDKLDRFDEYANRAYDELKQIIKEERRAMVNMARGRHAWGHYRYGDRNFDEWDDGTMQAAIREEIADAIVYLTKVIADRDAKLEG